MPLSPSFDSVYAQASSAPGTTDVDYVLPSDLRLYSLQIILAGHVKGDSVSVKLIDRDNIWGQGANTEVASLVNKWAVNPASTLQSLPAFAENLLLASGLVLRLSYVSIGTAVVDITANLQLYSYQL